MKEQGIQCVGFIMDGNRRWAKEKGKPSLEGHRAGYEILAQTASWTRDLNIPHLVVYAFSTENWGRSEEEVGYLMNLFRFIVNEQVDRMVTERVRVRFIGQRERFAKDLQEGMTRIEEATSKEYDVTLHIALSYGGRAEIVAAANQLLVEKSGPVTEEEFSQKLWSHPMPDPDIIVRTGGDMRLSGFLPWQTIYSELFFIPTLWPDFSKTEFEQIIEEFNSRERRRGK
jgi:undecaprenyl diphosphate synthase